VCHRGSIIQTIYYGWKKKLMASVGRVVRREAEKAGFAAGMSGAGIDPDEKRDRQDQGRESGAIDTLAPQRTTARYRRKSRSGLERMQLAKRRRGWPVK
jgi:hypothetical protein